MEWRRPTSSPASCRTTSGTISCACLDGLRVDDVPVVVLENVPDGSAAFAVTLGARAGVSPCGELLAEPERADRGDPLALRPGAEPRHRDPARARSPACRVRGRPSSLRASPARGCSRPTARCSARVGASRRSAARSLRRTPLRLLLGDVEAAQPQHYLAELPDGRCSATGCSAPACSCDARCSTRSAASTSASRCTARTSSCSTGPCAPAGSAGTCRMPCRHDYQRVIDRRFGDRRTLWHLQGMARFARKHPESVLRRSRAGLRRPSRSARPPCCPTRSTSRRSCARAGGRAARAGRTSCGSSARRSGSRR